LGKFSFHNRFSVCTKGRFIGNRFFLLRSKKVACSPNTLRSFLLNSLVVQRHFRSPSKHEAQASESLKSKPTRSRVVLVFSRFPQKWRCPTRKPTSTGHTRQVVVETDVMRFNSESVIWGDFPQAPRFAKRANRTQTRDFGCEIEPPH